jgi:hypothetical protein
MPTPAGQLQNGLHFLPALHHRQEDLIGASRDGAVDIGGGPRAETIDAAEHSGLRGRPRPLKVFERVDSNLRVRSGLPLALPAPLPIDDDAGHARVDRRANERGITRKEKELEGTPGQRFFHDFTPTATRDDPQGQGMRSPRRTSSRLSHAKALLMRRFGRSSRSRARTTFRPATRAAATSGNRRH